MRKIIKLMIGGGLMSATVACSTQGEPADYKIITDTELGCEYITAYGYNGEAGMYPRLDGNGNQHGCFKDGVSGE